MRTALAIVVAAMAAGCAPEADPSDLDPNWPAVEQYLRIGAGGPECDDPGSVETTDEGNRITCSWSRVTVGGDPTCLAIVVFTRESAGSPWAAPVVLTSQATICP